MLTVKLDQEDGIVILEPNGALTKSDFESAANAINPFIEKLGKLNGIIIHVKSFPGWDSFAALITHLKFIKDHHQKVTHVAFVTDSPIGNIAEKLGNHFVKAEVKDFSFNELEQAHNWVLGHASE
jgi:hypothetical protein